MTANGPDWVRLDALRPGAFAAIRRGDDCWAPDGIAPELAYLFGVISGDGSQSSPRIIQIANSDLDLLRRCQSIWKQHFGRPGFISASRNTYNLRVCGIALRQ